jgi:hypothetical protein
MNAVRFQAKDFRQNPVPDFSRRLCLIKGYQRLKNPDRSQGGNGVIGDFKHIVSDNVEPGTQNEEIFTWISILHSYER